MGRLTRRHRIAGAVLALVAVAFLVLDLTGGTLAGVHGGAQGGLGALYRGTDSVLGPVRRWVQGLPSAGTSQATIRRLEQDNARLRAQAAAGAADRATAARLDALQLAADATGRSVLPARVIATGPSGGFDWTVTVDTGSTSGVRADQTVTDGDGLVGRVLRADPTTAVVLLAADPGSGIGARDVRSGQLGVVTGRGSAGFSFSPLDPTTVLRVGDRLATGPAGASSYVAGLTIGTVQAVHTTAGGITTAQLTATTSPTSLDLVGILLTAAPADAARPALRPGPR